MKSSIRITKTGYLFLIGSLMFIFSSCKKDFLNNTNKTNLTDATQWASESTADIFLNDIYNNVPNKGNDPESLDNRWTPTNQNAKYPRATQAPYANNTVASD